MATRKSETKKLADDLQIMALQLSPTKALDLLPDVLALFAPAMSKLKGLKLPDKLDEMTLDDLSQFGPIATAMAEAMGGGRLMRLAPVLLSSSVVTVGKGKEARVFELDGSLDKIDEAFSDHVSKLPAAVRFAMGVTFTDFLSELGQLVGVTRTPSA